MLLFSDHLETDRSAKTVTVSLSHMEVIQMPADTGSGTLEAAEANATATFLLFLHECMLEGVNWVRNPDGDEADRFSFVVFHRDSGRCAVLMVPIVPLNRVRPSSTEYNQRDYDQLKVNVSNWYWKYAINSTRQAFELEEEPDKTWTVRECSVHGLISVDKQDPAICPAPSQEGTGQCGLELSGWFDVIRATEPD